MSNDSRIKAVKNSNFTLIELLVVIAIVALLASIFLPALSRARDTAKGIACTNNLKQIGLKFFMYADSSNDYVPICQTSAGNNYCWSKELYWDEIASIAPDETNYSLQTQLRYKKLPFLFCPSQSGRMKASELVDSNTYGVKYGAWASDTYIGDPYLVSGSGAGLKVALKITKIRNPSRMLLVSDSARKSSGIPGYRLSTNVAYIYLQHSKGANMLFGDGHVSNTRVGILTQDPGIWILMFRNLETF